MWLCCKSIGFSCGIQCRATTKNCKTTHVHLLSAKDCTIIAVSCYHKCQMMPCTVSKAKAEAAHDCRSDIFKLHAGVTTHLASRKTRTRTANSTNVKVPVVIRNDRDWLSNSALKKRATPTMPAMIRGMDSCSDACRLHCTSPALHTTHARVHQY